MTAVLTPRALRAQALVAGLLVAAVVFGRAELAALAAPFLLALAVGWRPGPVAAPEVALDGGPERALEGDRVTVTLTLTAQQALPEVEYVVAVPPGLQVRSGRTHAVVSVTAGRPHRAELTLEARRWGVHELGDVGLRVRGPLGLVAAEDVVARPLQVRVYPGPETMRTLLRPPDTQVYSGNYVARSQGEGIEFAGVRAFEPGDRVRQVNWRVSSRRGTLHVNERHPERNADVVIFLDTFEEVGPPGRSSLDLGVRGAAALARHYLRSKDRVGLLTFGGVVGWLTVSMGEMHVHRIVEYLLEVGVYPTYAWRDLTYLPPRLLPVSSLVIVLSPLVDDRAVAAALDLRRRGHHVAVIDTLDETWVAPGPRVEDRLAAKVWRLQREALRYELAEEGVPVARWDGEAPLEAALADLAVPPAYGPRSLR